MTIDDQIQLALQHFRAAQYQEAKRLFHDVYEQEPELRRISQQPI